MNGDNDRQPAPAPRHGDGDGRVNPGSELRAHLVRCVFCFHPFDLFSARWCGHPDEPHCSKVCPGCGQCLCRHPSYKDPYFWKEAPLAFQKNGFRRLFLLYM
jgi:hypothetical protein